jgi:hypothetical protein
MRIALLAAAALFLGGNIACAGPRESTPLAVADLQCYAGLSPSPGVPITFAP